TDDFRQAVDSGEIARRKEVEHRLLRRMVAYADSASCLRATILRYFGDPTAREPCEHCSVCERRAPLDDATRLFVRKILAGVARAGERSGRRRIAAMLAGDVEELPEPLTRLSTTGLLRGQPPRSIEQWIDAACAAGLMVASADRYRTLRLTPLGRDLMAGRTDQVMLAIPDAPRRPVGPALPDRSARRRHLR